MWELFLMLKIMLDLELLPGRKVISGHELQNKQKSPAYQADFLEWAQKLCLWTTSSVPVGSELVVNRPGDSQGSGQARLRAVRIRAGVVTVSVWELFCKSNLSCILLHFFLVYSKLFFSFLSWGIHDQSFILLFSAFNQDKYSHLFKYS